MKRTLLLALSSLIIFSCSDNADQKAEIDAGGNILNHIKVLASDDFMGRKPFTEGETKTVNYIKDEFEKLGVEPGNGSSYFQDVELVEIEATNMSTMTVKGGENELSFTYKDDFVALSRRVVEQIELEDSELVFAGFGVVAPEYGWNDYEGLDVEGKTVLVLVNDPGFNSGNEHLFKGDAMTYYGRWTYKYEEAARQGAAGIIIVHETEPASYPWAVVENSYSGPRLHLDAPDNNMSRCTVEGWVTIDVARRLFDNAGMTDYAFTSEARKPDFQAFSLKQTVDISFENKITKSTSKNVVGLIRGTEKPDEVVIYSGHWDHLGVGDPVDGDSIFNGAVDNASGIGAILDIARRFKETYEPKRSVMFIAVTAEEQGLLGSAYYAANPIFDPAKSVANLNIDAMSPLGPMKDFMIMGFGQSELDDYAAKYVEEQERYVLPDQNPGAGIFFRSDHFNFAKIGIPALFAKGGYDHREKGVEWTKEQNASFRANDYHQPSDEVDDAWDMRGIVQDTEVLFKMGNELANAIEVWPRWKEGSEFKAIRENP